MIKRRSLLTALGLAPLAPAVSSLELPAPSTELCKYIIEPMANDSGVVKIRSRSGNKYHFDKVLLTTEQTTWGDCAACSESHTMVQHRTFELEGVSLDYCFPHRKRLKEAPFDSFVVLPFCGLPGSGVVTLTYGGVNKLKYSIPADIFITGTDKSILWIP